MVPFDAGYLYGVLYGARRSSLLANDGGMSPVTGSRETLGDGMGNTARVMPVEGNLENSGRSGLLCATERPAFC